LRKYSTAKKAAQLGMPLGTAGSRLRKMILFSFIQRLHLDNCTRCGEPLTFEDFQVDHIENWLDVDVALFWALDNIGFSHANCNLQHQRKPRVGISRKRSIQYPLFRG